MHHPKIAPLVPSLQPTHQPAPAGNAPGSLGEPRQAAQGGMAAQRQPSGGASTGGAPSYSTATPRSRQVGFTTNTSGVVPFMDPFPDLPRDLEVGPPTSLTRPQQLLFLQSFPELVRRSACFRILAWKAVAVEDGKMLPAVNPQGGQARYSCRTCGVEKWPYMYGDQSSHLLDGSAICDCCLHTLSCSDCKQVKRPSCFSWTQKCSHADRRCKVCVDRAVFEKEAQEQAAAVAHRQAAAAFVVQACCRSCIHGTVLLP